MTSTSWFTTAGVALLLCFWALGAHNRLMALRSAIHAAWGPLDTLLTERGQTLAALWEGLRPHLPDEQAALDAGLAALTQVRVGVDQVRPKPSSADAVARLVAAEAALAPTLARLPTLLGADSPALQDADLAAALAALPTQDAHLSFARSAFNQAVSAYNAAVQQFPTVLLAPALGFGRAGVL
jgi:LemA protein